MAFYVRVLLAVVGLAILTHLTVILIMDAKMRRHFEVDCASGEPVHTSLNPITGHRNYSCD